jgi:hypothetical protein
LIRNRWKHRFLISSSGKYDRTFGLSKERGEDPTAPDQFCHMP